MSISRQLCFVTIMSVMSLRPGGSSKALPPDGGSTSIDGSYDFVSQTTELTKPNRTTQRREHSDWRGKLQLQNGQYSYLVMETKRGHFFDAKGLGDLGFEASAGPYTHERQSLVFTHEISLHPFDVGKAEGMQYKVDGDCLTLVKKLYAHVEDQREGIVTAVWCRNKRAGVP